ncbi:MAG: hypothetical protein ABJA60_09090 [Nitrosospira sp.]
MNDQLIPLFIALSGFILGVVLAWIILRAQIGAATERGKLDSMIEFATAKEKLRLLEEDRGEARARIAQLTEQSNDRLEALNVEREENSMLSERALQVPILAKEIVDWGEKQKDNEKTLLLLTKRDAETVNCSNLK